MRNIDLWRGLLLWVKRVKKKANYISFATLIWQFVSKIGWLQMTLKITWSLAKIKVSAIVLNKALCVCVPSWLVLFQYFKTKSTSPSTINILISSVFGLSSSCKDNNMKSKKPSSLGLKSKRDIFLKFFCIMYNFFLHQTQWIVCAPAAAATLV